MKLALDKKDSDLAAAQKAAQDKTALAEKKLASVGTLEGEVTRLTSCLNEANREVTSLKKDKVVLNEKLESAIRKRNDTEAYLRTLAKKLYLVLGGISFNPSVLMFAIGFWLQNFFKTLTKKLGGSRRVWTLSLPRSATKLR